jgi:outer membrane lipoprotein-sorting protein
MLSNPDFKVRVFESPKAYQIELAPTAKGLKDYFRNINVVVDKKLYAVSKIEMLELSGDNTIINFTNKELNGTLADALFAIH